MKRIAVVIVCLGLALGCGGKKKNGDEKPAGGDEQAKPAEPVEPKTPKELAIEFGEPGEAAAPFAEMQGAVTAAKDELAPCFGGTEATKANVTLAITAAGKVDSVSVSADRERAEECLRSALGPLQFPTWDGDPVELKLELRYE